MKTKTLKDSQVYFKFLHHEFQCLCESYSSSQQMEEPWPFHWHHDIQTCIAPIIVATIPNSAAATNATKVNQNACLGDLLRCAHRPGRETGAGSSDSAYKLCKRIAQWGYLSKSSRRVVSGLSYTVSPWWHLSGADILWSTSRTSLPLQRYQRELNSIFRSSHCWSWGGNSSRIVCRVS